MFLDTDDWWVKNKLDLQITTLKKNKDYKFVFQIIIYTFKKQVIKKFFLKKKLNQVK